MVASLPRRTALATLGCVLLLTLGGCGYPNRGHTLMRVTDAVGLGPDTAAFNPPALRLGVMPFDAWYSPWDPVDADRLGDHDHAGGGFLGGTRGGEVSRGVIYTERGGFLDVAHLRNAVDLTYFVHGHVAPAFAVDRPATLKLLAAEPDLYRVRVAAPPWATPEERAEAAVQVAGRVAYLMTTWHEVLTWFGYRGLGVVTERPSAFSYDDAASHRVGVELAMDVLREIAPDPVAPRLPDAAEIDAALFDAAVTQRLPGVLHALGAVTPEAATAAMRALEGRWWSSGRPILRVIDLGLAGSPLAAHLAEAGVDPAARRSWDFDAASAPAGVPLGDWFDVEIQPRSFEAGAIRAAAGVEAGRPLSPRRDFAQLERSLLKMPVP